jgi:hypothetical protein
MWEDEEGRQPGVCIRSERACHGDLFDRQTGKKACPPHVQTRDAAGQLSDKLEYAQLIQNTLFIVF